MEQEVAQTKKKDITAALEDIHRQLKKPVSQYNAVIFFASIEYEFPLLSKKIAEFFPNSKVIGASTSGEITSHGFEKGSLVVTTISDDATKFEGLLIENADKFPVIYKKQIETVADACGINSGRKGANKTSFALTFVNGLCNAEEATLALLNAVIGDSEFTIAGGSAGDDLQFNTTYVSYNGQVATHGAAILFVNTPHTFVVYKENIFHPTGVTATLTSVVPETRTITSIDGKTPRSRYAELLQIPESEVANAQLDHPLGRDYQGDVFITSIANFNQDGTIAMYSRTLQGSIVKVLEPSDPIETAKESCKKVKEMIRNPGFILQINCILRTIGFENKNITNSITSVWNENYPLYCGFSSYGEQINRLNANQSLLTLAIER